MEAKPERRCWLFIGDSLPVGLAIGRFGGALSLLDPLLACETGRAGASLGSTGRFCGWALLPRFSLKLLPIPGRGFALTGDGASARSGAFVALKSFMLVDWRMFSPKGVLDLDWKIVASAEPACVTGMRAGLSKTELCGGSNSNPGFTPFMDCPSPKGSSRGAERAADMAALAAVVADAELIGFGARGRSRCIVCIGSEPAEAKGALGS